MTRSDTLRREIAGLESNGAGLTRDQARHQEAANKAAAAASKKRGEASRTTSDSTRRMATSTAEREEKKAADALKKVGEAQAKIILPLSAPFRVSLPDHFHGSAAKSDR